MKPYYKNELTTIYNGDCLEVMDYLIEQDIKVDAIITDPPYGMNFQCGSRKIKYDKLKNDDNLDFLPSFIKKAHKIMNENSSIIIFCSWHNVEIFKNVIQEKFEIKNMLIWNKGGGSLGDLDGSYMYTYEIAFFAIKGKI